MGLLDRFRAPPPDGNDPAQTPMQNDTLLGHTPPAADPSEVRPRVGMTPLGASGRGNYYGLPQWDELNPKLIGQRGMMLLDEMYRTDAHVRRLVLAAWSPVTAGTWTLEPYGGEEASDQDHQIADAIWWMLTEWMSPNFYEHLYTLGPSLLRFGFTPFEQIWAPCEYKGKQLMGVRKLDWRAPKTVWRWWQDDFGELTHIGQLLPNKPDVVIPASELVYYRLGAEGDNWMGVSLLRHAYKHWYLKDKLERLDAVGQERRAVGMPALYHSPDIPEDTLSAVERALANMHMSEVAYLMMPGWKMGMAPKDGADGNQWLLDVVKFDSSSGDSINNSIDRHQQAIAASFLTDFLELGHHQVGARATAEVQEDPFLTAVNGALLPPVIPPLNRLVERIRKWNWPNAAGSPQLKLSLNDEASLSEVAAYVVPLIQAGAMQADPDLEDWLRDRASMPAANSEVRDLKQQASKAALENAAKLAASGETPGEEPPGANSDPAKPAEPPTAASGRQGGSAAAKPNPNPIRGAVENTGKQLDQPSVPVAGGVIVQAADTGRVLVAQRTPDDGDGPGVFGRFEFPGGKLDGGPDGSADRSAWQGARREWEEETGASLAGARRLGAFRSPDGAYQAFVVQVPSETGLSVGHGDRAETAKLDWRDPTALSDGTLSDRAQELLPQLERVLSRRQLDAPSPPPNLRASSDEDECCATCKMFYDGMCGGYWNQPVRSTWVCDSWVIGEQGDADPDRDGDDDRDPGGDEDGDGANPKPPASAGMQLDASAPLSGGTASADGLQMVPEVPAVKSSAGKTCTCGIGPWDKSGVCDACGGTDLGRRTLLDAAAEPTAKWWERLLSQNRLREAMDGARDHIEAAVGPAALTAARKMAHQAANGTSMSQSIEPPAELVDALTAHYTDLYQLGRETVADELARQRVALQRKLDGPGDTATGAAASRLARARQRGEHSARMIVSKIAERLGRDQITGLKDPQTLQTGAEAAATGALRMEALANAAAQINDGRADRGLSASDIAGAIYTSCLDGSTCLAPTASVTTRAGLKHAQEVTLSDELLTHAGRYRRPSAITISEVEGELLTIYAGASALTVTADHQILVAADAGFVWRPAGQLRIGDLVVSDATLKRTAERSPRDVGLTQTPDRKAAGKQIGSLTAVDIRAEFMPVGAVSLDDQFPDLEVDDPWSDLGLRAGADAEPVQVFADDPLERRFGVAGAIAARTAVTPFRLLAGDHAESAAAVSAVDEDGRPPARLAAEATPVASEPVAERLAAAFAGDSFATMRQAARARAIGVTGGVRCRHAEGELTAGADLRDPVALTLARAVDNAPLEPVRKTLATPFAGDGRVFGIGGEAASVYQPLLVRDAPTVFSHARFASPGARTHTTSAVRTRLIHDGIVLLPVDEIATLPYAGSVYDFTIPDDHTFWVDGVLVHNCGACEAADTGDVLSPEDAVLLGPPNPDCSGQDRCRCCLIWVLSNDPSALAAIT